MGYTNVRDYAGGKQDWNDARLPVESGGHEIKGNVNTDDEAGGSGVALLQLYRKRDRLLPDLDLELDVAREDWSA